MAELKPCKPCKCKCKQINYTYDFKTKKYNMVCAKCRKEGLAKNIPEQAIDAWNKRS